MATSTRTPTPALPTASEIEARRRVLTARHRELVEQRGGIALAAAGGAPDAVAAAREHADALTDIVTMLAGLDLAEAEVKRRAEQQREQEAAEQRARLVAERRDVRQQLGDALVGIESTLSELGEQFNRVCQLARQDATLATMAGDQSASTIGLTLGHRIAGRLRAAMASRWPGTLVGAPDVRPLGDGDAR